MVRFSMYQCVLIDSLINYKFLLHNPTVAYFLALEISLRQARVIFRGQNSYSEPYRLQQRARKRYMIIAATCASHPTSTEGIT